MKIDTEALADSKVKVVLTAEPEDVDNVFAKTYSRISQQGRIPGFRPGKAPATLIKRHYGEDLIREMAWSTFLEDVFLPALDESDLQMIFHPEIPKLEDAEDFAEGQAVQIETTVTVHPETKLPDYRSLRLLKSLPEATDEEIDQQLEELRESYAEELEVDRDTVAEGDSVHVAMKVLSPDGEVLEESESQFIADRNSDQPVARKLSGHVIGQVVTDETSISENFEDKRLAGQKVQIEATIASLKERTLPDLDDDFARDLDEELADLEALRGRIREQLEAAKVRASERALRNMAITLVMQAADIDLPPELVANVAASQVESYMQYLQGQGLSTEQSVEALHGEQETVTSEVVDALKLHYVFTTIAEDEDIEISDEEVQAAIPEYAADNNLDEQMLRDAVQVHEETEGRLRSFVLHNRIIQILIDGAEIEEVAWEAYPLRARRHMEQYVEELRGTGPAAKASDKSEAAEGEAAFVPEGDPPVVPEEPVNEQSEED